MQSLQGVLVLMVLCLVSAFGQKPDFTGTWRQVDTSGWARIERIQHQDPSLKRAFDSREVATSPSSLQRPLGAFMGEEEYRTDGTEQVDNNTHGRQRWRTVSWQGSALVFLTVVKDGYRVSVNRESWTLSAGGNMLTRTIRKINMDGVTEKTLVFQRE